MNIYYVKVSVFRAGETEGSSVRTFTHTLRVTEVSESDAIDTAMHRTFKFRDEWLTASLVA